MWIELVFNLSHDLNTEGQVTGNFKELSMNFLRPIGRYWSRLTWLRPPEVLQEHRLSDKAPVSDLIHEPAHEAVSVDAVEQDAGLVVRGAAVMRL